MDKYVLLAQLPADQDKFIEVSEDQTVPDIIDQILNSHYENQSLYDRIALYFNATTVEEICENISDFELSHIEYREESQEVQTVKMPQGLLTRGFGDCKHFASFAGGVLGGIERLTGRKIDWCYRFASYQLLRRDPYHVYVVVFDRGREINIDVTPGADGKQPVWIIDKKVKSSVGLYKQIAGVNDDGAYAETLDVEANADHDVPAELVGPTQYLLNLGVLTPLGGFNEARYRFLTAVYGPAERSLLEISLQRLMEAEGATVGNFFDDAFKGVQHFAAGMGMQVPRASFLILVKMNAFGYANKLAKALEITEAREALENAWWRVGGQPDKLREAIEHGKNLPPVTTVEEEQTKKLKELAMAGGTYKDANGILHDINTGAVVSGAAVGIVPVVAAAIISSAAIIVSAIMPLITKLLDKHQAVTPGLPLDPITGLPVGYSTGNPITNFIKNNPLVVAAIAAALGYYVYENYS